MRHDEFTQCEWRDASDDLHKCEKKYKTAEWNILAVNKPEKDEIAVRPPQSTFGVVMGTRDIIAGI
jgi:hypothetical protein